MKLVYFLFFFIFKTLISDDNPEHFLLTLNSEVKNELKEKKTDYYILKPFDNPKNQDLLIRLIPRDDEEHSYDPDLYVSIENHFPGLFTSDYVSERVGEDMVTLPSKYFTGKDIYIAVYCGSKCKYTLFAEFKEMVLISAGQLIGLNMKKDNVFYFKYNHNEINAEHIEILTYTNSYSGKYKLYVAKNSVPTISNTLSVTPFMLGGYSVIIEKNSPSYCVDCYYQIMLETYDTVEDIYVLVRTSNSLIRLKKNVVQLGITMAGKRSCFIYNLSRKDQDENIIITTNIFSGNATLHVNPWILPNEKKDFYLSYNLDDFEMLRLVPSMRNIQTKSFGEMFFCLYAEKTSIYYLNVYLENEIEKNQAKNILSAGLTAVGFLPPKNITSYKLQYYGYEPRVSVSLITTSGNPSLYGYICEEKKCEFDSDQMRKNKYNTIKSYKFHDKQLLNVEQIDNKCFNKNINDCTIFSVIVCEGTIECVYQISYIHENSQLAMIESSPYHNFVSNNKYDYYKFYISSDKNIEKITIILTPLSGKGELYLSKTNGFPSKSDNLKSAINTIYTPDVITYSNKDGNLTGYYYLSVFGSSECYYSIYYYITYIEDDMLSPVYLNNGYVIKDYFNLTTNKFRLYIFTTKSYPSLSHLGVIFSLTYETFEYDLYAYNDKTKVYYNETTNQMENYLFKSSEGEIIIENTNKNFVKDSNYYIAVVIKDYYLKHDIVNTLGKFYIAAQFQGLPLVIHEGVANLFTLRNQMNQSYVYLHADVKNDVFISLDIFYGDVILYANPMKSIIDKDKAKYKSTPKLLQSVIISSKDLEGCDKFFLYFCPINILVEKRLLESQYILTVDSQTKKPIMFRKDFSSSYQVLPSETKYHYTTIHKNDTGVINIDFKHGKATCYGRIISNSDELRKPQQDWIKPDRFNSNLHLEANTVGYSLILSKELIKSCDPCILLFSLTGESLNYQDLDIIYSISFITSALRISLNQPLKGVIGDREINYYVFNFPKDISNLYIQLINVQGDSDLIMNYGSNLPTLEKNDWRSASSFTDIIDIDINDNFYTNRGMKSMQGIYTVGVVGYTASTYVLYATSHSKKVQYIRNEVSASCMTKIDGEWCYFRYETGFQKNTKGDELDKEYLLVNTEYVYGTGIIFAKVFNTTGEEVFKQLPTKDDFEWSSQQQNRRDYLFMEVYKNMLVKKHGFIDILIGVFCVKRCFFTITPAIQFSTEDKYITHGKENLIYMDSDKRIALKYFNPNIKEVYIEAHTFMGEATLDIYERKTNFQIIETTLTKRIEISEDAYSQHLTYSPILKYENGDKCFIDAVIQTKKKTGFFLKIDDLTQIKKFKVGTVNEIVFVNSIHSYYGFFEIFPDYESININLTPQKVNRDDHLNMKIFAKLKIVDKSKFYDDPRSDVPDESNFDYRDEYDPNLNRFSFKLPGVKFNEDETTKNNRSKMAIYLITVKCYNMQSNYSVFDLSIIPQVNSITRFDLKPGKAIFASIDVAPNSYHIYDIGKFKSKDNVIELQISQCSGNIDFKFSNQVNYLDTDSVNTIQNIQFKNGRYIALLQNIETSYFLTVLGQSGHKKLPTCYWDVFKKYHCTPNNGTVADYMVYFESFNKDNYYTFEAKDTGIIQYEIVSTNTVKINWGSVMKKYITGLETSWEKAEATYNVYITDNEEDAKTMQSLCSLEYSDRVIKSALNITQNSHEISGLEQNKKYYVNIVALVKGGNGLTYLPLEIELKYIISWVFIVLVLLVVVIVIGVAVYYFRKFKRTEKILEFETGIKSDAFVGNLSVTEMSSKRNMRYGTLVEESNIQTEQKVESLDK